MGLFLITSERWLTLRNQSNLCKLSAVRRPPPPLLIANAERESFVSMADHWNKSNLNLFNSNFKNPFCFWAKIASPKLISGSVSRVVDVFLKFMPSDKLCPRLLWLTTRNMLMNKARKLSRISSSNLTELSLLLTQDDANPRNSEVPEPGPDTKSLTVKIILVIL